MPSEHFWPRSPDCLAEESTTVDTIDQPLRISRPPVKQRGLSQQSAKTSSSSSTIKRTLSIDDNESLNDIILPPKRDYTPQMPPSSSAQSKDPESEDIKETNAYKVAYPPPMTRRRQRREEREAKWEPKEALTGTEKRALVQQYHDNQQRKEQHVLNEFRQMLEDQKPHRTDAKK